MEVLRIVVVHEMHIEDIKIEIIINGLVNELIDEQQIIVVYIIQDQ